MNQINVQTRNLSIFSGMVSFRVESSEETFINKPFQNLSELITLLSPETRHQLSVNQNDESIVVDSIQFLSQSEDQTIRVETLLMEDENYIELVSKQTQLN